MFFGNFLIIVGIIMIFVIDIYYLVIVVLYDMFEIFLLGGVLFVGDFV